MTNDFKIGMLTPSSNVRLEPLTVAMLRDVPNVTAHFSRLPVLGSTLDPKATAQFNREAFLQAARLLADARVNLICWNGTSGSWLGPSWEDELCAAIESETGIPAVGSTRAILETMRNFNIERYSLAVPYYQDLTDKIVETYAKEGFTCVGTDYLSQGSNVETDKVTMDEWRAQLERMALPQAQAIAVVCTNVPAAPLAEEIEAKYDLMVVDSIAATLWKCLDTLGVDAKIEGWGRQFR